MKKKLINSLLLVIVILSFNKCTEIKNWDETIVDNVPPGKVSNPEVINIPGGAIITYSLPDDKDLLGVKAVYSYKENSEIFEAFSSAYTDTIKIEGFPDTEERDVQLIAIDESKNESQPVRVIIKPLTPPVELVRNSLKVASTFGGVFVSWDNITKESIGISLFAEDSTGFMNLDYTYFSKEKNDFYTFRGFNDVQRKFRVIVRDKWNNSSQFLDTLLTPFYEEDIIYRDKSGNLLWQRYGYADKTTLFRGDYTSHYWDDRFEKAFDGITTHAGYFNTGLADTFYPSLYTLNPEDDEWENELRTMYVIIDMIKEVKFSRFKIYGRSYDINPYDMIEFRLWASNETPKQPEDFNFDRIKSLQYWTNWSQIGATDEWKNDWVNLGYFHVIPPSGATELFQWTKEDTQWWQAGVEFDIDPTKTIYPFRYLRIESINNIIGDLNNRHIIEMEFYGTFNE